MTIFSIVGRVKCSALQPGKILNVPIAAQRLVGGRGEYGPFEATVAARDKKFYSGVIGSLAIDEVKPSPPQAPRWNLPEILQGIKYEYIARDNADSKARQYLEDHWQTAQELANEVVERGDNPLKFPRSIIKKLDALFASLPEDAIDLIMDVSYKADAELAFEIDSNLGNVDQEFANDLLLLRDSQREFEMSSPGKRLAECLSFTRPVLFAPIVAEARGEKLFSDNTGRMETNEFVERLIEKELPKLECLLEGFSEEKVEYILTGIFLMSAPDSHDNSNPAYQRFVREISGEFLRLGKDFFHWLIREDENIDTYLELPRSGVSDFVFAFSQKIEGYPYDYDQMLARYYSIAN
jgi:hypothetical protein